MSTVQPAAQPAQPSPRRSFFARVLGVVSFDATAFDDIASDRSALFQAALVVVVAGMARGFGAAAREGIIGVGASAAFGVLFWMFASALIWLVGVRFLGHTSDYPTVLRSLGFAAAPLLGLALGALPLPIVAQRGIGIVFHGAALYVMVYAVRAALRVPMRRALWVCLLGAFGAFLILALLST